MTSQHEEGTKTYPLPSDPRVEITMGGSPEEQQAQFQKLREFFQNKENFQQKPDWGKFTGIVLGVSVLAVFAAWVLGAAVAIGVLAYNFVMGFAG